MAQVRARLSADHGRTFALAGVDLAAFPTPNQLLAVQQVDGLTDQKVARLHGVARAAQEGLLDAARLRSLDRRRPDSRCRPWTGSGRSTPTSSWCERWAGPTSCPATSPG